MLAERLADIDGLRSRVRNLTDEKAQFERDHQWQVAGLDSKIHNLEAERATLSAEVARLNAVLNGVNTTVDTLPKTIPHTEIGEALGGDMYTYLLKDSRVPRTVIDGVGKFIDFRKYLRLAATRGAEEATKQSEQTLRNALSK